jgi:peroxiredoxin
MQSVSYLQSDAKVHPGSSGGPMVDSAGNVIGIINSKYGNMEGRCATFATAVNEAKTLLARVEQGQPAALPPAPPVTKPATAQTSCSEVGCHAPDFSLATPDGKTITLSSLKGKKVILAFMSTRCSTCLQLILCIQQFYDNWPREQMEVVAIVSQEKAADVASWTKTYGLKNPAVLDPAGEVYNKYRPEKVPALYFLNSDGTIKIKKYGQIDDCATELDSLLRMY